MNEKIGDIILLKSNESNKNIQSWQDEYFNFAFISEPYPKSLLITTACWCKHQPPTFTRSRFNPKLLKTKKSL